MCADSGYSIEPETFDTLASHQRSLSYNMDWEPLFVLPDWMRVWWQAFGSGSELYLRSVRRGEQTIGFAPLRLNSDTASFVGSVDVCDYLDFVVAPGAEREFFAVILDDLSQKGVRQLDLKPVRPESRVMTSLVPLAQERGLSAAVTSEDRSLEVDLPATWDEYLEVLSRKQRHEVRRKLRRLSEEGNVSYRVFADSEAIDSLMPGFFDLFSKSREDKAVFLTPQMESFFRSMAHVMSGAGLLRLGSLELNGRVAAMVILFDYHNRIYLYNSGYDPQLKRVSVGLMSKVWSIQESIAEGKVRYDFLRGGEEYKYHLGGKEVPLYHCQLTLK